MGPTHAAISMQGTMKISFEGSSAAMQSYYLGVDIDCSLEEIEIRPIRLLLKYCNYEF